MLSISMYEPRFLFATDEVLEDEVKFLESLSKMPRPSLFLSNERVH